MELVGQKEILKLGYQKESERTFFKTKNDRYFRCGKCGAWSHTTSKIDKLSRLITRCEWCDGSFVMQIFKPTACRVVWVVIECEPPHAVSLVGLTPEFLEHAERKLRWAMVKWGTCLKADSWPGYDSRIAWLDLPAWAQAQFTERLFTEEAT